MIRNMKDLRHAHPGKLNQDLAKVMFGIFFAGKTDGDIQRWGQSPIKSAAFRFAAVDELERRRKMEKE